jgi:hypothetical protein
MLPREALARKLLPWQAADLVRQPVTVPAVPDTT